MLNKYNEVASVCLIEQKVASNTLDFIEYWISSHFIHVMSIWTNYNGTASVS